MSELTKKDKAKAMRNGQMKMAKEGCVWTIEDDLLLRDMFEDGDDKEIEEFPVDELIFRPAT